MFTRSTSMSDPTYYAPGFKDPEMFHSLAEPTAIYGHCGKQIDNSNDQLRDRRPPKHVCPKCDEITGYKSDSKDD
jgi:hypothetical protein